MCLWIIQADKCRLSSLVVVPTWYSIIWIWHTLGVWLAFSLRWISIFKKFPYEKYCCKQCFCICLHMDFWKSFSGTDNKGQTRYWPHIFQRICENVYDLHDHYSLILPNIWWCHFPYILPNLMGRNVIFWKFAFSSLPLRLISL